MKNSNIQKVILFAIILFISSTTKMQAQIVTSGFYPKQNDFTVAISYGTKSNDDFYVGTEIGGNPAGLGTISADIINLYAEYGITDWLSGTVTLPYISVKSDDGVLDPVLNTDKVTEFQDLGLYIKGKIYEANMGNGAAFKLGGTLGFAFPISDYEGKGVISVGNRANDFSTVISTQFMLPFGLFAEAQGGYSFRSSDEFDIPNAVLFTGKLGYCHKYFYVDTVLGVQNSQDGLNIGTTEFGDAGAANILPETDVDYTELSFNLYAPFYKDMLGASAGYTTTLSGRNFNNASGFSLGLVYTLK